MPKITKATRLRRLDKELSRYKELPDFGGTAIREIRETLGMSSAQLASRIGLTPSAIIKMEESEKDESITIRTLKRAAEALGCRLVYALVPETLLAQFVRDQAQRKVKAQTKNIFRTMQLEQQSTEKSEQDELIEELIQELIRKGGRKLWT
jgi:predicted DNA-binding mobile mystery protein A